MVVSGYKKSLVEDDLWNLNKEDRSQHVVPKFEANWNKEMLNSQRYEKLNSIRPTHRVENTSETPPSTR